MPKSNYLVRIFITLACKFQVFFCICKLLSVVDLLLYILILLLNFCRKCEDIVWKHFDELKLKWAKALIYMRKGVAAPAPETNLKWLE
jgi:hypothetical protein